MMNLISLARDKGITQKHIAELADVSPQAVLRYEQCLYETLSDNIANVLSELLDLPLETVYTKYVSERYNIQREAYKSLIPLPPLHIISGEHPFLTWRKAITTRCRGTESRMSFCILLAVHPGVVAEYDSGNVRRMPPLIKRALLTTGITSAYVNGLDAIGDIWYGRHS